MVEAEVTFKADLEKLLKQEGHMPEDKFLVVSRKGKRLTVIAGNCACCAPGLAGLSVIFAATSAARLILRPCSPRLHLRPEARRLRPHQARTAAPIRHRGCDRTHENRRPPRQLGPMRTSGLGDEMQGGIRNAEGLQELSAPNVLDRRCLTPSVSR